jgi:hypothetical protein
VVEDSETTLEDLRAAGIPEPAIQAVAASSKRSSESYNELMK